jgi:hypothetical protein
MTHSTLLGIGHCRFIVIFWGTAQRAGMFFFFALSVFSKKFTAQKGGVHAAAVLLHFASGAQDGTNSRKKSVFSDFAEHIATELIFFF